jgi:cytochrome oxidase Cu insertion factor (SCO1/SenC/PrrC family)
MNEETPMWITILIILGVIVLFWLVFGGTASHHSDYYMTDEEAESYEQIINSNPDFAY